VHVDDEVRGDDGLAAELGARGVRVLTVMPGPIAGERIDGVFARMDELQQLPPGSTAAGFLGSMQLLRPTADGRLAPRYPTMNEVAAAIALAADPANAAVSAQTVAVTNAMQVHAPAAAWLAAVPPLPDLHGRRILLLDDGPDDAVAAAAEQLAAAGADVTAALRSGASAAYAPTVRMIVADGEPLPRLAAAIAACGAARPDTLVFGSPPIDGAAAGLLAADDAQIARFQRNVLIERTALAVAAARLLPSTAALPLRVVFCSSPASTPYHALLRAATTQLVRVWQQEAGSRMIVRQLQTDGRRSAAAGLAWTAAAAAADLPLDVLLPARPADDAAYAV
jgi:hypothetical protein